MVSSFSFSNSVIGFILDGSFSEKTLNKIKLEVSEKLQVYDKLNLYVEDTTNANISFKVLLKGLPFRRKNANRFKKIAVVTDRRWIQWLSAIEKIYLNAEIKRFPVKERLEAIQWIAH